METAAWIIFGALMGAGLAYSICAIREAMRVDILMRQPIGIVLRDLKAGEAIIRSDVATSGHVVFRVDDET